MSDVLERAFSLVSILASSERSTLSLPDIAARSGLPSSTCCRLLGRLRKLGWVDQHERRGLFSAGPRLFALASRAPYRDELLQLAQPIMRRLSALSHCACSLSCLRGDERQLLYIVQPHSGGELHLSSHADCYATASGRCLLAALPASRRRRFCNRLGLPSGSAWPGIISDHELHESLREIRRAGCISRWRMSTRDTAAGAVIGSDGHPIALGIFSDDTLRDEQLTHLQHSLEALAAAL